MINVLIPDDDFNALTIDGVPFNSLVTAFEAYPEKSDREEIDAAVRVWAGSRRQAVLTALQDRESVSLQAANEARLVAETKASQAQQLAEEYQRLADDALKSKAEAVAAVVEPLNRQVAALSEEIRVLQLPSKEQELARLEALESQIAAKRAELTAQED